MVVFDWHKQKEITMSNDLATSTLPDAATMESLIIGGDLSKLSPAQRVSYYGQVCKSIGLNPLTKPFEYINLNGKLTLYARKDATDQLRNIYNISIEKPDIQFQDDWIIVTVSASNGKRTDSDVGVVNKKDMRGDFGNALMKAVTKAKRRVTLSICGLGMLDETEVETIPTAKPVVVAETGEIVDGQVSEIPAALKHLEGICTSDGQSYPTLSSETLANHSIGIGKVLAENHITPEKKAEYQRKQDAIKEILDWRKSNPAA